MTKHIDDFTLGLFVGSVQDAVTLEKLDLLERRLLEAHPQAPQLRRLLVVIGMRRHVLAKE